LKNKPFRVFVFTAAFIFSAGMLRGFGAAEEKTAKTEEAKPRYFRDRNGPAPLPEKDAGAESKPLETVRVTGRVRLVGSGPYTELVISGPGGEWHIEPEDRDKLIKLQQRVVTVEGARDSLELILPNKQQPGVWLVLRDITVISCE
jgi:hypothetical protein